MVFEIPQKQILASRVGDIIRVDGHNYKVRKKTNAAIAVDRYYWYDGIIDNLLHFLGRVLP